MGWDRRREMRKEKEEESKNNVRERTGEEAVMAVGRGKTRNRDLYQTRRYICD